MKPGVRRILLYVVKGTLSALLLYLLLRGGKWERIVALTRASFHLAPFLLGFAAFAMSNLLGGLRLGCPRARCSHVADCWHWPIGIAASSKVTETPSLLL